MRILIACDKFKGSLTAVEACAALREGLEQAGWTEEIAVCPIADGGEGFAESLVDALGGEWRRCDSYDALHNPLPVRYGVVRSAGGEKQAVIEMAEASGLHRIPSDERSVVHASTFGTGSMMWDAVKGGAQRIMVGIGGSATNDAGVGMAAALGTRFLDRNGKALDPVPAAMEALASIDESGRLALPPVEAACDVDNPLLGTNGASRIYGPQKGASAEEVDLLEAALARVAEVAGRPELAEAPGAGAAGGLGFGLMRFADARLRSGFEMVAEAVGLEEHILAADVVITGEGSLDAQTLQGKGPMGVANLARDRGKRVIGVGGRVDEVVAQSNRFDASFSLESFELGQEESMERAGELLRTLAVNLAGLLRHWRRR